jgi:hypothetical protein
MVDFERARKRARSFYAEHKAGLLAAAIALVMFVLYRLRRKFGLNV